MAASFFDAIHCQSWKKPVQAVLIPSRWAYNSCPARQSPQSGHLNQEEPTMSKRLNKQALIDAVKRQVAEKRPDLAKADVEAVLDALGETLRNELAEGNIVPITGFGIFELKETAGRTGRNPQSGEPITIAASKSVRFKLAAPFKAQLNGGKEGASD
jgi:DNA-binding protein HU-beta